MARDALVVGINPYRVYQSLTASAADAEAIARSLELHGDFTVRRLPESLDSNDRPFVDGKVEVTIPLRGRYANAELEKELERLFCPQGDRQIPDTALFYFSGHGWCKQSALREGFLATSEINPRIGLNGLSLRWLRELLQASPIKQQIVWLDCCYSGRFLSLEEANPGEVGKARDRCFIAASREYELAYQDGDDRSILTKALLAGLDPKASPNPTVTNYSLVDSIDRQFVNAPQRPIFTNLGEAIVLTRRHSEVAAPPTETKPKDCPYKGLLAFTEADSDNFFGREDLTKTLVDRVRQSNFLALLGASGSGKSSVLQAGLVRKLKDGRSLAGSESWQFRLFKPGTRPLQSLAQAFLDNTVSDLERSRQLAIAEERIAEGAIGLRRLVQSCTAPRTVLICDQFEEVFTLCEDVAKREQFFEILFGELDTTVGANGVRPNSNVRSNTDVPPAPLLLIVAMRADFFGKCLEREYCGLADRVRDNMITVQPMNREQLTEAIVKPAQPEVEIEPELVAKMLDDVAGSPGSLPLLQYALAQLWEQREGNRVPLSAYVHLGGVTGSLERRADAVFEGLSATEREAAQHIFLSLTQLGEGTEDTRRRVRLRDLVTAKFGEELVDRVVRRLADAKLLVTSDRGEERPPSPNPFPQNREKGDSDSPLPPLGEGPGVRAKTQSLQGDPVVDVAHEALIRHWVRLRRWLEACREALREKRKIEAAAREWRERGQLPDYLLQGRRLREALAFQHERGEEFGLSTDDAAFVAASVKQQRWNRVKGVAVFLVIPLVGTVFLVNELRLHQYNRTVDNCRGIERCPGRIAALEGLNEAKHDIRHFNLRNAYLESIQIPNPNLERANLERANLGRANLEGANLEGANLFEANLFEANLEGANLEGANLFEANLEGANLEGANLFEANLEGANLEGANLEGINTNLTSEQIKLTCNWQEAKFDDEFWQELGNIPDPDLLQGSCRGWNTSQQDLLPCIGSECLPPSIITPYTNYP